MSLNYKTTLIIVAVYREDYTDLCEFSGLAHDLGHPPFGHQGEEALDECMRDFGGFEGNAQTLRILSKLEKKKEDYTQSISKDDIRIGLNLTYRSLASILKYDNQIPKEQKDRSPEQKNKPIKGYYYTEADLVKEIKNNVIGDSEFQGFKTLECQIMDIADDIAYSTYDLEDGLKAGFYHPSTLLTYPKSVYEKVAQKVSKAIDKKFTAQMVIDTLQRIFEDVFSIDYRNDEDWINVSLEGSDDEYYAISEKAINISLLNFINRINTLSHLTAKNGALRREITSKLVNTAIESVELKIDQKNPSQSKVDLSTKVRIGVEVLKNFTYESQILSPRLKVAEYRGKHIVKDIFKALDNDENGWMLMPEDYQEIFTECKTPIEKRDVFVTLYQG